MGYSMLPAYRFFQTVFGGRRVTVYAETSASRFEGLCVSGFDRREGGNPTDSMQALTSFGRLNPKIGNRNSRCPGESVSDRHSMPKSGNGCRTPD